MKKQRVPSLRSLKMGFTLCIFIILAITISFFSGLELLLTQIGWLRESENAWTLFPVLVSALVSLPLGTLVTTVMSGLVDENDRCIFGEYPGKLRDVLGIWVEEVDALKPEERNHIVMNGAIALPRESYECSFLCDLLHPRAARALAVYGDDFYAGMPCVTVNEFGKGKAYAVEADVRKFASWVESETLVA